MRPIRCIIDILITDSLKFMDLIKLFFLSLKTKYKHKFMREISNFISPRDPFFSKNWSYVSNTRQRSTATVVSLHKFIHTRS